MALFKKLFGKRDTDKTPKGFVQATISNIDQLTSDTVKVTLSASDDNSSFDFTPGQYITFLLNINGEELRRSYSICSGTNENLAVAVKQVENGKASTWFNKEATAGTAVLISKPEGNFVVPNDAKNVVAIAAGSGITPILSIAKKLDKEHKSLRLLYGSRTEKSIIFKDELAQLKSTDTTHYLSAEEKEGFKYGRIDKDALSTAVKSDLEILKSDCFLICGPEQMIVDAKEVLEMFGVSSDKIIFELFTTPVLMKTETATTSDFKGTAKVTLVVDGEYETFDLPHNGLNIVEKASEEGLDVPYSCKGGVCSSCKAKVTKGHATMTMNYSLSDKEVAEGYILACQAHPASSEVEINFDE